MPVLKVSINELGYDPYIHQVINGPINSSVKVKFYYFMTDFPKSFAIGS